MSRSTAAVAAATAATAAADRGMLTGLISPVGAADMSRCTPLATAAKCGLGAFAGESCCASLLMRGAACMCLSESTARPSEL